MKLCVDYVGLLFWPTLYLNAGCTIVITECISNMFVKLCAVSELSIVAKYERFVFQPIAIL